MFDKIKKMLLTKEKAIEVITGYLKNKTEERLRIRTENKKLIDMAFLTYGYYKKTLDNDFVTTVGYYFESERNK